MGRIKSSSLLIFFNMQGYGQGDRKYYFQAVSALFLDFLLSQFEERFAGHHNIATSSCTLVPHYFRKATFQDLNQALLFYKKCLIGDILDSVNDYDAKFKLRAKRKDFPLA